MKGAILFGRNKKTRSEERAFKMLMSFFYLSIAPNTRFIKVFRASFLSVPCCIIL